MSADRAPLIVFNPGSRKGAAVARALRESGVAGDCAWVPVQELFTLAGGISPSRVVAVGGDGTVNAVAQWLHERSIDVPVGIVPAGTGNNLARGLGLPLQVLPAAHLALGKSRERRIDAIVYRTSGERDRQRLLVQTGALGFPARIAAQYDHLRRGSLFRALCRPLGPQVYRGLALLGLASQKRRERRGEGLLELECRLPGETLREKVFAVFFGNERSLGGNFYPCPRAQLDDGLFDLCLVRSGTGESYLNLFGKVARGRHLELDQTVIYRQTPGPIELRLSAPEAFLADGDLWVTAADLRFEVHPRRFRVLAPGEPSDSAGP